MQSPINESIIEPKKQGLLHTNETVHSCLFENSQFINQRWRFILSQIVCEIDKDKVGIEVISPFGFEVMEDKRFLKTSLKRFYCYIGVPFDHYGSGSNIRQAFEDKLFKKLSDQYSEFYSQVVLKVSGNNFTKLRDNGYICNQTDKLVDIQCRFVKSSILDDYADYVICSLSAIYYGKDEPKEFIGNARFRNRTYQLYVMLEKIFSNYAGPLNDRQAGHLKNAFKKINNQIDIFYDEQILYSAADDLDHIILNELIMPRVKAMIDGLYKLGDVTEINCKSYHVEDELSIIINKYAYYKAKNFIKLSYLHYI